MASGLFSTHRQINRQHVELYTGRVTMDPRPNCMVVQQTVCVKYRGLTTQLCAWTNISSCIFEEKYIVKDSRAEWSCRSLKRFNFTLWWYIYVKGTFRYLQSLTVHIFPKGIVKLSFWCTQSCHQATNSIADIDGRPLTTRWTNVHVSWKNRLYYPDGLLLCGEMLINCITVKPSFVCCCLVRDTQLVAWAFLYVHAEKAQHWLHVAEIAWIYGHFNLLWHSLFPYNS